MTDQDYELPAIAAMRMAKPKDVRKMRLTNGGQVLLKYMVAQGLVTAPDADGNHRLTAKGRELAERERALAEGGHCTWPGCAEKSERPFPDGWAYYVDGPDLLPGLPANGFLCPTHTLAFKALVVDQEPATNSAH